MHRQYNRQTIGKNQTAQDCTQGLFWNTPGSCFESHNFGTFFDWTIGELPGSLMRQGHPSWGSDKGRKPDAPYLYYTRFTRQNSKDDVNQQELASSTISP